MMVYHAHVGDGSAFGEVPPGQLKQGDFLKVAAMADGELWLSRVSSSTVVSRELARLGDIEAAAIKAAGR